MKRVFDFYTIHAIVYHTLYYAKVIPSTYAIALFVFIGGTMLQLFHHNKETDGTCYQKTRLFLLHAVPLLFFKHKHVRYEPFVYSVLIYILYMGSFQKIKSVYSNMYTHLYL